MGGPLDGHPRYVIAGNPGPFTLDGTRTYIVGAKQAAVIDPGPDLDEHLAILVSELAEAEEVMVIVTHGHADHAAAAPRLAERLRTEVWGPSGVSVVDHELEDGEKVPTDEGYLAVLHTAGHARHHISLHWPDRQALFAGDLLLGEGDTTWVGEYPGCVDDYLRSLNRLRHLELEVIYPAHGDPLKDPTEAINRFEDHRNNRIEQMEMMLARHPGATVDQLLSLMHGYKLPEAAKRAAKMSLVALKEHVEAENR